MYDAILILGGGLKSDGTLPPWVVSRVERALKVWQGEPLIALSAGTAHKPAVLNSRGFQRLESVAAADYLLARGVDRKSILTENVSYDTIGNAYFSRVIHVDPRGFRSLLVVTSEFHLARTKVIFEWIYSLDPPPNPYKLDFLSSSDDGIPPHDLAARQRKEQDGLRSLANLTDRFTTMEELHKWLFTEHKAYAVGLHPEDDVSAAAANTY